MFRKINHGHLVSIEMESIDLVKLMITDSNVNIPDDDGRTALGVWISTPTHNINILKHLLEHHAAIDRNSWMFTWFQRCASTNARRLITHYTGLGFHDQGDIIRAFQAQDAAQAEKLILTGADVSIKDADGNGVLHYIYGMFMTPFKSDNILERFERVLDICIKNGCDVNSKNKWGYVPMHQASKCSLEYAQALLSRGADPNVALSEERTLLHEFIRIPIIVELLIQNGARIDAETADGMTPLHLAVRYGCVDSVAILLAAGANRSAKTHYGEMPLDYAINKPELIDLLNKN